MRSRRIVLMAPMALLLVLLSKFLAYGDGRHGEKKATPLILDRVGSSFVFPIHGDVYPTGYYNVTMEIGDPPKPYFLDIDTGSDLTWLQCDAPCVQCTEAPHELYRPHDNLVACSDGACASIHESEAYTCETPDQCDYEVQYADGGSSLGVLVNDVLLLNSSTTAATAKTTISFGCGYDQVPGGTNQPLDGVIGLGRGRSSIASQLQKQGILRNVLGHCLSRRGGGFLFFGDDLHAASSITWAAMSAKQSKHYSLDLGELVYGGKSTGLRNLFVSFDSGSSYTYLNSVAYNALAFLIKRELVGKPMREAEDDQTLPLCWKGKKPMGSIQEVKKYFKAMALSFSNGGRAKSRFEFHPEDYLIISVSTAAAIVLQHRMGLPQPASPVGPAHHHTAVSHAHPQGPNISTFTCMHILTYIQVWCLQVKGNVCLGVLNGTEIGLRDINVIGDVSMQGKLMIYDNERQAIGWTGADCDL